MKIIIPGTRDTSESAALIPLDAERLSALASRQIVIRPEHAGLAEFLLDPAHPDMRIEGSVLAFNPEAQHDEAVGLKLVRVDAHGARTAVPLQQTRHGVSAEFREGEQVGLYVFTPSPNTNTTQRFEQVCMDRGTVVRVQGVRKRSLVCTVRFGAHPLATNENGEMPVPFYAYEEGFPRAYLETQKRQTLGVLQPGLGGYQRRVNQESIPLIFGKNVPANTDLTVAVLEYVQHHDLRTAPLSQRPQIQLLLSGSAALSASPVVPDAPVDIRELDVPQHRLLTGMQVQMKQGLAVSDMPISE